MVRPLIETIDLHYTYQPDSKAPIHALRGIDLTIREQEYVAIVGHNGSGKSTLARCLNGLLQPTEGDVFVHGHSTADPDSLIEIRATVGIVLQNPENQFVATTVEEEIAFGPENLALPRGVIAERVASALESTGLVALRNRAPRHLSAGQQARLAIAGMIAMAPACLILDESTAMLDPLARRHVLDLAHTLSQNGMAIVNITHNMEEAALAQRVVVMEAGQIALQGAPAHVFGQREALAAYQLELPVAAELAHRLERRGLDLPAGILTAQDLAEALQQTEAVGRG